jgi:hypothetical protein
MKRIIALLALASFLAGQNAKNTPPAGDGYKELAAVATSADVLTLDDGRQIQLHNGDRLSIGETYILLLDPVNDDELLNYWDLETYELNNFITE